MPSKTPARISVLLTILSLIVIAVITVLTQMLALNGASERQGMTAMGISLGCQGVVLIVATLLASRLTKTFIEKFKWSNIPSVIAAIILSIPLAGIS
ncbi:MAG: hypothetical protein L0287_06200 [Anaerolineae bacterium]|nr:hypothetical protein [Anaerolineae bacterium]